MEGLVSVALRMYEKGFDIELGLNLVSVQHTFCSS